jgi:phospholipid/cholesterol/gamma-HCH transport system substrate-binding protein
VTHRPGWLRGWRLPAAGALVAVLAIGGLAAPLQGPSEKHATAYFSRLVGLYVGDQVRAMGVPIGRVDAIVPAADSVRVEFSYDADIPVSADANALVLAPTLVTERFVQLTPVRPEGPLLPDGAVIGLDRTAVPVEFDELKDQLGELTTVLGPEGANADGALSRVVSTAAKNLDGNGTTVNQTVAQLAAALGALSDGREDLFGTVRHLGTAVSALRSSDTQVRDLTIQLGQLSDTLARSSAELGTALDTLDSSVTRIGGFVEENREPLTANVEGLNKVVANLADNRQALADLLQAFPSTAANFQNVYDPFSGSLTGALAATQFQDLTNLTCSMLFATGGGYQECVKAGNPLLGMTHLDYPPVAVNALQRNGSRNSIAPEEGRRPDPNPTVQPPYNPGRTPPKPHQGAGTQPYRGGSTSPDQQDALVRLFAPTRAGR